MLNKVYLKLLIFIRSLDESNTYWKRYKYCKPAEKKSPSLFVLPIWAILRWWNLCSNLSKRAQPCDHHLYRPGVILDSFTLNKTTPNGLSLIVLSSESTYLCVHTFSPCISKILCSIFHHPFCCIYVCVCFQPLPMYTPLAGSRLCSLWASYHQLPPRKRGSCQLRDFMSHSNSHKTAVNRQKQSSDIMIITIAITIPFILTQMDL